MVVVLEAKYKGVLRHYELDGMYKTEIKKKLKKLMHKAGIYTVLHWKVVESIGAEGVEDEGATDQV